MDSNDDQPRAVYDCAKLDRFQQFESPNVYLHSPFLQTEMTVLGWAVYFAGRDLDECREIIKYASSVEDSDPYLPMREGFFRGKTAREVAEYYQRKELAGLLEKMEKKFESKKTAASKPNLSRRDSKGFVGVALPFRAGAKTSFSAKSNVVGGKTGADLDPDTFAKHQHAILMYLEQVGIPADERDEVCRTLMESRFYSLKQLSRAEREDLNQLGFNQPTVDLLLSQQHTIIGGEDTPPPSLPQSAPAVVVAAVEAPLTPMAASAEEERGEEDPDAVEFHERVRQMQVDLEREEAEEAILKRALHGGNDDDDDGAAVANQDDSLFDASPRKPSPKAAVQTTTTITQTAAMNRPPLPSHKQFHFYLSYSWGKHQVVKNQVDTLAKMLRHRGYLVWLDVEQFGDDIETDCRDGVAHSCVFLACLTMGYVDNIKANRSWNAVEMTAAKQTGAHMLGLQFDSQASLPALVTVDFTQPPNQWDEDIITNLLTAVVDWI
ncbi:hypothetical protein BASA81_003550 [Batrachochytrium salamandrivorans]|nr:hypothetical protein BASA81_003550 [Batrachochytrium salamandrivorans]